MQLPKVTSNSNLKHSLLLLAISGAALFVKNPESQEKAAALIDLATQLANDEHAQANANPAVPNQPPEWVPAKY